MNLRALDALRGGLALYVLLGHARWLLWAGHAEWLRQPHACWELPLAYASAGLRFGHEAVMVFFVLSGFFIHLRAAGQLAAGRPATCPPGSFYQRRWHRLGVPFLAALGLTLALDLVGQACFPRLYLAQTGDALLDANFARKGYTLESVLPALLLLPTSFGHDFGTNGPLWSLAFEVVYYTAYPLWLAVRRRSGLAAGGLGVAGAVLGAGGWLPGFLGGVALHYPLWLAGAFLAELASRPAGFDRVRWAVLLAPALILPSFLRLPALAMTALYLVGGLAVVLAFARLPVWFSESGIGRSAEYLGLRSYTIYICHFPMLVLLSAWVIQTQGTRPLNGWLALVGGGVSLGACLVMFYGVERHYLHARLGLPKTS